jgi:hypothetical protein
MSPKPKRRKCRCCRTFFFPDYRNRRHQRYCSKPECQHASKLASQRRWYHKPANLSHFRNGEGTARVQAWRRQHPGYWRRQTPSSDRGQAPAPQAVNPEQSSRNATRGLPLALQDYCLAKEPAFIGLISMFSGTALRDDIQVLTHRLIERGCSILGHVPPESANAKTDIHYDHQTSAAARSGAASAQQL